MSIPKIICPCCNSEIAKVNQGRIVFDNMKAVSIIELDLTTNSKEVKCHSCHNWLSIDSANNVEVNYKRKGSDILHNQNTVTYKKSNNINPNKR